MITKSDQLLTRRNFLSLTAITTCAFITPSKIINNQILAPKEAEAPQPVALTPILVWLGKFAAGIAADVIANSLADWVKGKLNKTQSTAKKAVNYLEKSGYTGFKTAPVYNYNSYYIYGVPANNKYQALTVFQYSPSEYTMLGGPLLWGLYGLHGHIARSYSKLPPETLAPYVLPNGPISLDCYCFSFYNPWSLSYRTQTGFVKMNYEPLSLPDIGYNGIIPGVGSLSCTSYKSKSSVYGAVRGNLQYT